MPDLPRANAMRREYFDAKAALRTLEENRPRWWRGRRKWQEKVDELRLEVAYLYRVTWAIFDIEMAELESDAD